MQLKDIPECDRYEYIKKCQCGKIYRIMTQEDSCPEYHTDIYLSCDCGEWVLFSLPVN